MGHVNVKATSKENYIPKYRHVNKLTIYFATKDSIFVTDGKVAIVLERWFDTKIGFYSGNWRPLVETLGKKKSIETVYDVWKLADYYDVARHQTFRFPEISDKAIEIKERKQ